MRDGVGTEDRDQQGHEQTGIWVLTGSDDVEAFPADPPSANRPSRSVAYTIENGVGQRVVKDEDVYTSRRSMFSAIIPFPRRRPDPMRMLQLATGGVIFPAQRRAYGSEREPWSALG
jgi:hypothetical protein